MKSFALALSLFLLAAPAVAVEVYKWTDPNGRVHYGDSAPEGKKSPATTVVIRDDTLTDAQREDAQARLARDRTPSKSPPAMAAAPAAAAAPASPPQAAMTGCEAAWKSYHDSQACFAPYRMRGGRVRPDVPLRCVEVLSPTEACR